MKTIPTEYLPLLVQMRAEGFDFNSSLDHLIQSTPPKEETSTPAAPEITLNSDQKTALDRIKAWLESKDKYFALRGGAGTGKSLLLSHVAKLPYNFYFSAPTNKATKILSEFLGTNARTTYSLLGLRMVNEEDQKVLAAVTVPDLGNDPILVIDEAGMLASDLVDLLVKMKYRCLFVGDPAQLNPVGEITSKAWKLTKEHRVLLKKVERFDNQLLRLSLALRKCLKEQNWKSPIKDDNDGKEGVFVQSRSAFEKKILSYSLADWDNNKVCCWRNKTVEGYNNIIRDNLGFENDYEIGERILLGSPISRYGSIVAYTDEEFVVANIDRRIFNFEDFSVDSYLLDVGREFILNVPVDPAKFASRQAKLAASASRESGAARKAAWNKFWEFTETFASVRYGYAMTCHRLQGSTVDAIHVDQTDILVNPNKPEAFRALNVAATRPRFKLYTF